jgi:hypothetical protein
MGWTYTRASGKDTITRALASLDSRYALFHRFKVGSGNTGGYRMASPGDLAALRERGQVLYLNDRYGSTYVVDRPHLAALLGAGQVPVSVACRGVASAVAGRFGYGRARLPGRPEGPCGVSAARERVDKRKRGAGLHAWPRIGHASPAKYDKTGTLRVSNSDSRYAG